MVNEHEASDILAHGSGLGRRDWREIRCCDRRLRSAGTRYTGGSPIVTARTSTTTSSPESAARSRPGCRFSTSVPDGPRPSRPGSVRSAAVGLDISKLARAPVGSYDSVVVADLVDPLPQLMESFDLIVSFQVLEHVRPLDRAVENMRRYLRANGRLVAQLSGTFSLFGIGVLHRRRRALSRVREREGRRFESFTAQSARKSGRAERGH